MVRLARALPVGLLVVLSLVPRPAQADRLGSSLLYSFPCGQWKEVAGPPATGDQALDAVLSVSGTDAWTVGGSFFNGPLAEHWDGSAWTPVPVPGDGFLGYGFILTALSAVSPTDVWAVGYGWDVSSDPFLPIIEHWDGSAWSIVPSPGYNQLYGPMEALYSVSAVSANDVWAAGWAGETGSTAFEHWDGTAWTLVASPAFSANAVDAVSSSDVWGVGYGGSAYHWNGTAWSTYSIPYNSYYALAARGSTDVWAVGGDGLGATAHWDGAKWTSFPVSAPAYSLHGVAIFSANNAWAVGESHDSQGTVSPLIEHWDGSAWSPVPAPDLAQPYFTLQGVAGGSPTDVWAVGGRDATGVPRIEHLSAIDVQDGGFSPSSCQVGYGSGVSWSIDPADAQAHEVKDASGLNLFDSGSRGAGGSFAYTFVGAGTFNIWDPPTGHTSSVSVPITAAPPTGDTVTTFTVGWASAVPPTGDAYDVQIMRPGGGWTDWKVGQTATTATFVPDAGAGTYSFQARVRNPASGLSSGYSPASSISVVQATADLGLTMTDSPDPVTADSTLTYTLGLTVTGDDSARDATLTDTLPTGVIFLSATPSQGTCSGSSVVTCSLGTVPAAGSATVTIAIQPVAPGALTNAASATTSSYDPNPSNNSAMAQTTVNGAPNTVYDSVRDSGFDPNVIKPGRGGTVQFNFFGTGTHSAKDGSGMGLFDSGPKAPTSFYSFTFVATGYYPVVDSFSSSTATVQVPPTVSPTFGGTGTTFTVTWASGPLPAGYVEDIQILRPGASSFVDWKTGQTGTSASFVPDAGLGVYKFQARLRNPANGASSDWCFPFTINVDVLVLDSGYSPVSATVAQKSLVTWDVVASDLQSHSVTDSSGMGLFDSGILPPNSFYSFQFVGAGSYNIVDDVSAKRSKILVPVVATPPSGGTGTIFTITWAGKSPPSGYVFDVQIKRPSGTWVDWKTGQSRLSGKFQADAGPGTYAFRGRIRKSSTGKASDYSPAALITVNP